MFWLGLFLIIDKFILPSLISGLDTSKCRHSSVCTIDNCFGVKKLKAREAVFLSATKLSKRLAVQSSQTVDASFIKKVFSTYERGVDFYNHYLSIERCEKEKKR